MPNVNKSGLLALAEIGRKQSKRATWYHILLREIVDSYHKAPNVRDNPVYCEHCGRWIDITFYSDHIETLVDHADDCVIKRAERSLCASSDEMAEMIEAWARENMADAD